MADHKECKAELATFSCLLEILNLLSVHVFRNSCAHAFYVVSCPDLGSGIGVCVCGWKNGKRNGDDNP